MVKTITAEIFMIWTNVAGKNVDRTNITIMVGIWTKVNLIVRSCSRWFQEPSLVNIGLVTAEIFIIWTNVPRTNVASTNVNLIVGICSRCSQEATFKVPLKLGQ